MMKSLSVRIGISLIFLACTSCSTGEDASEQRKGDAAKPPAISLEGGVELPPLPIGAYGIGEEEGYVLDQARVAVVNRCLARSPVDFRLPSPPKVDESGYSRRYGVIDAHVAATYGYHDARDESAASVPPEPNAKEKKLLFGQDGRGGCMREANLALGSDTVPSRGVDIARTIDVTSFQESQKLPEITEVFSEWSSCMSRRGWDYPSPMAAAGGDWFVSASPSPQEKRVAQADAACKDEVDLVDRWHRAESKLQQRMIRDNTEELEGLKRFHSGMVEKARSLLRETRS
ncbi:hypothetical protein ACGF14_08810 [Streptomyces althioticus]|uniref:hypothetical protein n=1 Tax=Streptomyces althioticus TaxID=83380 RepID=UPI0036B3D1D1